VSVTAAVTAGTGVLRHCDVNDLSGTLELSTTVLQYARRYARFFEVHGGYVGGAYVQLIGDGL